MPTGGINRGIQATCRVENGNTELYGGERGIRTLDRAFQPYNGLANRRLQPLGHLSGSVALSIQGSPCRRSGPLPRISAGREPSPLLSASQVKWLSPRCLQRGFL